MKERALGFAQLGNEDVIKLRQAVILAAYNQILVYFRVSGAVFPHQTEP